MAKTRRSKQRPDLSSLRDMARGSVPASVAHGVVVANDDNTLEHYIFDSSDADVYVEVMCEPDGRRISARLGGHAAQTGSGVWSIPQIGTEVRVLFVDGADPSIVGCLSSGELPTLLVSDGSLSLVIQRKAGNVRIKATQSPPVGEIPALFGAVYIEAEGQISITATTPSSVVVNGGAAAVARVGDTVTVDRDLIIAACEGAFIPMFPAVPIGADATGTITTGAARFKG